jgi:uncharacterized membrane protein
MGFVRFVLLIVGVLALAIGLLWIGQGTGYVHWPKQSFMINEMVWAYRGAGVALAGLIAIVLSRRI